MIATGQEYKVGKQIKTTREYGEDETSRVWGRSQQSGKGVLSSQW